VFEEFSLVYFDVDESEVSLGVEVLLGGESHQKSLPDDVIERSSRLVGAPRRNRSMYLSIFCKIRNVKTFCQCPLASLEM
jgi:hypothetical protein